MITNNALLALARLHALRNHVGKATRNVGGRTDPMFTKANVQENSNALYKKGQTMVSDNFEVRGEK